MAFTNTEKREAADREVKQRERVYPRFVENRKMTQDFADRQIALMREIADDYRKLEEKDRLI